jgi:hypothetical protein
LALNISFAYDVAGIVDGHKSDIEKLRSENEILKRYCRRLEEDTRRQICRFSFYNYCSLLIRYSRIRHGRFGKEEEKKRRRRTPGVRL